MKKLFLTGAVASLMLVLTAPQAKAILFTGIDTVNKKLTAGGSGNTYTSTFNLVDDGILSGAHNVWAAGITFRVVNNGGFSESGGSFTINLFGGGTSQYTTFLVLGAKQIGIDLLANLNSNGILTYSVSATSGDFWLESASLAAEATITSPSDSQSVPDHGSTLILAAFALISLTVVQRRIAQRC